MCPPTGDDCAQHAESINENKTFAGIRLSLILLLKNTCLEIFKRFHIKSHLFPFYITREHIYISLLDGVFNKNVAVSWHVLPFLTC